ncbi:MAG: hypothetical protein LBJ95_00465 [Oscillospiraceae bacterium]|nr:hypothetical protein [Oscillospiraceae bacterium]
MYSTTNIYTQFFDVDSILPFIYVLSLDGEHRVVRLVTGIIYQDGPYSCVQLPWRCRNSFAMSNQPLQLGTRINPEDDVVVLRRVYGPGPTIVRAPAHRASQPPAVTPNRHHEPATPSSLPWPTLHSTTDGERQIFDTGRYFTDIYELEPDRPHRVVR